MNYLRLLQLRRMGAMMAPDAGGMTGGEEDGGAGPSGGTGAAGDGGDADEAQDGGGQAARTFTQEDVDRIVRREQAKWKRQQETAVQRARTEAERLAGMTAQERAQEQAQQREAELNRRETEITRRELRAQALEALAARQMPGELAELLDYTDAERCSTSLETLSSTFSAAVQKGVEARVAAGAPRTGGGKAGPKTMREAIDAYYRK